MLNKLIRGVDKAYDKSTRLNLIEDYCKSEEVKFHNPQYLILYALDKKYINLREATDFLIKADDTGKQFVFDSHINRKEVK